eukprot:TRINITY_DN7100_c0_g2_i3.p1 TRINITY_DN7100_c0_g2~~TRINITY_DN7100_c0_g2_i3.p1  ORF type:complete len:112 (-),score=23.92 TRINITY_DN7100_c0_g2_i3:32-367(-)
MDPLRVFWDAVVKSESLNSVDLNCWWASSKEFDFVADQFANQPNSLISMIIGWTKSMKCQRALTRLLKHCLILLNEIRFSSTFGNTIVPAELSGSLLKSVACSRLHLSSNP